MSGYAGRVFARIVNLVVYVAIPVAGLVWFGWDWRSIILLYWLENIIVGLSNIISMGRAPQVQGKTPLTWNDSDRPVGRVGMMVFFGAHYGFFTLVHGIFVLLICAGVFGFGGGGGARPIGFDGIDWGGILLVWVVGGAVQLLFACLAPRDGLPAASVLFWQPYRRIFALHVAVIGGVWLIERFDWPPVAAVLLVALHFVFDLLFDLLGGSRKSALGDRTNVL